MAIPVAIKIIPATMCSVLPIRRIPLSRLRNLPAKSVAATLNQGIALLSVYALGLGLPFLAAALFAGKFLSRLKGMRHMALPPIATSAGVGFIKRDDLFRCRIVLYAPQVQGS